MSREPVAEDRTVWRCPICSKRFDMRQYCEAHIKDQHPKPTPEALALIGSFLSFEVLNNRYIMRVDRVTEDTVVGGPAMVLGWEGCVEFKESYWILCDKTKHDVLDEDEAGQVWKGWCTDFADKLLKRADTAWGLMLGKEGEE